MAIGVPGVPHELTPPSTLPDWSLLMHNAHVSDKKFAFSSIFIVACEQALCLGKG